MNRAKSVFVSLYIALLCAGLIRAGLFVAAPDHRLAGLWIILALLPGLVFFAWLYLARAARTGYMSVIMWLPGLCALAGALISRSLDAETAFWIVGVGLLGALVYIRWYSRFTHRDESALKVGASLSPMRFADEQGQPLDTATLEGPLLLMFYRGNWCPLCMAQIREVAAQYQVLEQRGVHVLAISPQPAAHSASLARRFDVNIRFCVDEDGRVARQLGIFAENGLPMGLQVLGYDSDTVLPTVVIADADRTIIYADLTNNYRIRPDPDQFIRILDQAGIGAP